MTFTTYLFKKQKKNGKSGFSESHGKLATILTSNTCNKNNY